MLAMTEQEIIARRFRLKQPPVLVVDGVGDHPITFARLRSDAPGHGLTLAVPPEEAFAFQVMLRHLDSAECWVDGKHNRVSSSEPGSTFLFDLTSNPITQLETPFDTVRFYIAKSTLDKLGYESGCGTSGGLVARSLGVFDPVMHGLALSIAAALDDMPVDLGLFAEGIALAFHVHVAHTYGCDGLSRVLPGPRGGLAPWQLRRAGEMMLSNLQATSSIGAMAAECKISASHFARAFKQTTGLAPHQWLLAKRMEAAKDLLMDTDVRISEIALACGFVDQSHFSSVFGRKEGLSPAKWRRQRLK
jgi:AraC-like DNA-binding protein